MKTKNTKTQKNSIAILSASLNAVGDGWYQLLPAGEFKARDGRPYDIEKGCWYLDEDIAQAFIQRTIEESKGKPILIDYDHQTLYKNENGQKAPAAGRIVDPSADIEWRSDGIYIRPRWTPVAESEIANEQFNDLSAVFPYDQDGRPLYLRMAAITNDPALLEIKSLVALAAEFFSKDKKEIEMNEALKRLLVLLGIIEADGSMELNDENITELTEQAAEKINTLIIASQAAVDVSNTLDEATTTESAIADIVDVVDGSLSEIEEAELIVEEATLNGIDLRKAVPVSAYQRLSTRYAALNASAGNSGINELLRRGRRRGQVTNANVSYLTALGCKYGVAALSAAINAIPPITALSTKQTKVVDKPTKQPTYTAVLSASEKEAARLLGISESEYQKRKKGATK